MTLNKPRLKLMLLPALGVLLLACDNSVGTSTNPDLGTGETGYSGPAAKTEDIRSFEFNFWTFLQEDNRCGQCHDDGDQAPTFVDTTDVNKAYSQAINYVSLLEPASSLFVSKVGGGHNCWLSSLTACATNIEQMISNWATDSNVESAREIQLTAPQIKDPGTAKSFPPTANTAGTNGTSFADTVHPILIGSAAGIGTDNCQGCHEEIAQPLPIAPFFANDDVNSAFESAKSKLDIDTPSNSRFVIRLGSEFHNCWSNSCASDATDMEAAITLFANGIAPTPVDPNLVTSKALNLTDGIVATGGNRHESNLVALWEFKTGSGLTAYDTSGIDPAVDLTLVGSVNWLGGYGLDFSGGRAQANTQDSDKLHTFIQSTGEYAIEAWITPANVTQEDANIISYSGGDLARNFTLGQRMYNYDFYNRSSLSNGNGEPFFTSDDNNDNEILQATLQHVVINYDPINGRNIYVNGQLVANVSDPNSEPSSINAVWNDSFTLILGNETSGQRSWSGNLRMVAVHNRVLTDTQVQKNFDLGVGEKYFLLFYVGHQIGIDDAYIMFEVAQFDSYSYLFNKPTFINLDSDWAQVAIDIQGMRIGINGKEARTGQAFANIDVTIDSSYSSATGQELSPLGTIVALEKGSATDEFFLTFERLGTETKVFLEAPVTVAADPSDPANPVESDIGMRTFDEINATIAEITGTPITNAVIDSIYDDYMQQLPTVETIDAFLPSHQMAIAQLALMSCSEMVNNNGSSYFPGFNFAAGALSAFDTAQKRAQIVGPLLTAVLNVDQANASNNLTSQPNEIEVSDLLGSTVTQDLDASLSNDAYESLITQLLVGSANTTARTAQIVKAVCASATGGAVMLVQ